MADQLERELATGLEKAKSVLGLSSIQLYFQRGTDLITARQLVQERLTLSASRPPNVVNQPVILPPLSSLSRALKIGMWSDTHSQMDMTVFCKWNIRPRLMAIPGVANVAIWGDYDKQFQVQSPNSAGTSLTEAADR